MFRKALLLSVSYYLLAIALSSCDPCGCRPQPDLTVHWKNLLISNHSYTSSNLYDVPDTTIDFSNKNYMLQAVLDYEALASNYQKRNSLLNEAYACSCVDAVLKVPIPITDFRVITINKYDDLHPAGSEITDRFGSPYIENGLLKEIGPLRRPLNMSQDDGVTGINYFFLFMKERPESGSVQQFKVVLTLKDSTVHTELTPELKF